MKFLVVDNSATMRRIIIDSLQRIGYEKCVEDIVEAAQAGVNNYVVKPLTPEVLKRGIEQVLAERGAA